MRLKLADFFTVRKVLTFLLMLSVGYAAYGIYYKVKYWVFTLSPRAITDVWTVEAKVSFNASGGDTSVSLAVQND